MLCYGWAACIIPAMTTSRTRKPRKKTTTDIGRSILQRERQKLAKEQAELAEKLAEDAARSRRANRAKTKVNPLTTAEAAMQRSIVRRVAGALASEGVLVPIEAHVIPEAQGVTAWTDFDRIYAGYHLHDDVRITAAVLRGELYHEGGHCRFTDPFVDMEVDAKNECGFTGTVDEFRIALAGRDMTRAEMHRAWNAMEDQRMETAVVSDSPRKAGYLTPMMLSELAYTPEMASANWPLMVWRKYLPRKIRDGAKALFMMEHGAEIVRQIQVVVTRYVLAQNATDMYMATVEMAEIFKTITPAADLGNEGMGHGHQRSRRGERSGEQCQGIPVSSDMIEENDDEIDSIPEPGQEGGKPSKASKAPKAEAPKADDAEDAGDEDAEDDDESDDEGASKGEQKSDDAGDSAAPETEGGASGTHEDDGSDVKEPEPAPSKADAGDDDDESDEGDESDDDGDSEGDEDEDDEDDDDGLTQEDLEEALAEAEEERLNDPTLDQDVQAFQDAKNDTATALKPYVGGICNNPLDVAEANNLADQMQRAFETATAELQPVWREQEKKGILNVIRYETRQPGDTEFFRRYVDNGNPGCDIAVSVLLDYSGSMGGVTKELAKVAYACKRAGDLLEIPVTVTLWDTDARVLWDASEQAEHLPVIEEQGGTNPQIALNDLDNQRYGKNKHVVLIMTDDAWNGGAPSLASYKQEGRLIIGLGYTDGQYNSYIQKSMEEKGADFAYSIKDLAEIPRHLEQALVTMA